MNTDKFKMEWKIENSLESDEKCDVVERAYSMASYLQKVVGYAKCALATPHGIERKMLGWM